MAVTKTDQFNVWPIPGQTDDWLTDGQGVHTVFARDLVTQLNNIGSYCSPWPQYMQSCTPGGAASVLGLVGTFTAAAGEFTIFQCPIVVPAGAIRMLWTAGVTCVAATSATIESAKVYLSSQPYTATTMTGTAAAFDPNGIFPRQRLLGNVVTPISSAYFPVNLSAAGYKLVSDTDINLVTGKGGVMGLDPACVTVSSGTGQTRISNLIFTLKISQSTSLDFGVADFTCWFGYE